jgi:hypothetical protein
LLCAFLSTTFGISKSKISIRDLDTFIVKIFGYFSLQHFGASDELWLIVSNDTPHK